MTEGQKALFATFPDTFRIRLYPSRRSAAYPQGIYNETKLNATRVQLVEQENGYADLFLANAGSNRLLHNNRDGTFTDATAESGISNLQSWFLLLRSDLRLSALICGQCLLL